MSEPNQNWHAVCDKSDGMVLVRPLGKTSKYTYNLDPKEATQLRDELTDAIAEAKRQADGFERWWETLDGAPCFDAKYRRQFFGNVTIGKEVARAIWDAATKAAQ